MLNRKYRATRTNIEEAMKIGQPVFAKFLNAKISKNEAKNANFAIIVTKKNEKTSVGRHLIKRKISAYIEEYIPKINPKFKKTVIFILKKTQEPLDYKEVKKDVEFVLKKVAF